MLNKCLFWRQHKYFFANDNDEINQPHIIVLLTDAEKMLKNVYRQFLTNEIHKEHKGRLFCTCISTSSV